MGHAANTEGLPHQQTPGHSRQGDPQCSRSLACHSLPHSRSPPPEAASRARRNPEQHERGAVEATLAYECRNRCCGDGNPASTDYANRKISNHSPTNDEIDSAEIGNPASPDYRNRPKLDTDGNVNAEWQRLDADTPANPNPDNR